ncbi:general substrate transporter [Filobasidium floriforme]|uniref:general substrate transporter n=1 Tax=Filobasidium floriforme TaxID=5210 RepID=UPI001E8D1E16|nr:general substrate transporter [Filobasidium floriforme]KAH8080079.1 general substrate transporter [Filobasidium floriforme]
MSAPLTQDNIDSKVEVEDHIEDLKENPQAQPSANILSSGVAALTTRQAMRRFWRLLLIGFSVSVSGMYLGFTLTIPGSIIVNQGFIDQFGTVRNAETGKLELNAVHVSIWGGTNFAVQVLLQMLSPITADRFGLRPNMYIFTFFMLLAIIVEIVAKDWKAFLAAKILAGMSAGFIGTTIMSYISEITISQLRGPHLSAFSFFFAFGQLMAAVGLQVLETTTPDKYLNAFYSEFAIFGIWLAILVCLPESPVWLCKMGREEKSKKAMRRLVGNVRDYDIDHEYLVMKHHLAESQALMEKSSKLGWIACFKGTNLRRTLISTIPFSMQNFVGGPLVLGYTVYFFSLAGVEDAFQANLIIFCILVSAILASFYFVEKVGRRPLLIYGGAIMAICDIVIGVIGTVELSSKTGTGLIVVSVVWVIAYAMSVAPIGYVAIVENSTPMLRAKTAGIAAVLQSLSGVIFNYTVPIMLSEQQANWGAKTGYFFGGLAVLFTILVWFTVPETQGRTYEELDELYERRLPAWRFKGARTLKDDQMVDQE